MKKILLPAQKNFSSCFFTALLLVCLLDGFSVPEKRADSGFKTAMGEKYNKAVRYFWSSSWPADTFRNAGIDPLFAAAIVFPEAVRYIELHDKIQIAGLLVLYANFGDQYADFSIGNFQMKPSFAEQIEKDAAIYKIPGIPVFNPAQDTPHSRSERVKRLNSPLWQARYLAAFIRILDTRCQNKNWCNTEEKLRFYATAYNAGYTKAPETIASLAMSKTFYTTMLPGKDRYCYSNIALEYFSFLEKIQGKISEKK